MLLTLCRLRAILKIIGIAVLDVLAVVADSVNEEFRLETACVFDYPQPEFNLYGEVFQSQRLDGIAVQVLEIFGFIG